MKAVTPQFRTALEAFLTEQGMSATGLAESLGWARATIARWLNGSVSRISPEKYAALLPLLRPYLPPEEATPGNARPAPAAAAPRVPLIGFASAADYEASLMSATDYALSLADGDTAGFVQAREGDVALQIQGDSMLPWYPPGTVLLCRPGEFPETGDIVVARLADGALLCKRYHRHNGHITLEALNDGPDGQTITWHIRSEPGKVLWMWPVIMSQRDERAIRHAAKSMGQYQ